MPGAEDSSGARKLEDVVRELDLYPLEAFRFVEQGLSYTARQVHAGKDVAQLSEDERHITGQQLCEGLRRFALRNWGLLARTVLQRWNITCTYDFGRIVFALIEAGYMHKTEQDTIEDFRDVYDFSTAFEGDYRIEQES